MKRSPTRHIVFMPEKIATGSAPLTTPITQTSVFVVPSLAGVAPLCRAIAISISTRYSTPTVKAAEDKIAALEGAEEAVITSSGMSAILVAALPVAKLETRSSPCSTSTAER